MRGFGGDTRVSPSCILALPGAKDYSHVNPRCGTQSTLSRRVAKIPLLDEIKHPFATSLL